VYRSCARLSDLAIARRIADDGIDILVDLTGYTTYSRPTILALRPAPVAIQHAGYVSSLGARFVEWQLADHYLVGPQQRSAFSERLLFMPHCVFPVSPLQGLVSVGTGELSRQEVGLPEDVPVLASFNAPYKLDPETFDSWATILRSAPDAVLWLYDGGEPKFSTNLRSEAKARGVDPNRLFFAGKIPYPKHLQRYALADLFLDSFVYNGGATTIDALRMGLPVLTLPGNGPLARMGGSIVHAAGLGDQVAISPEAYVNRAVEVANSREAAAEWRRRVLAARQAPLFDLREWTRDYGKGLLAIWSNTANNQTGDIDLSAQAPA
jgi:predicted O-linked N-acetylglucosamine transferase (SPINDLY family)